MNFHQPEENIALIGERFEPAQEYLVSDRSTVSDILSGTETWRSPVMDASRYRLSRLAAGVTLIKSAIGVLYPQIIRDPPMTAGNARGTDAVLLLVALPVLSASMILARYGQYGAPESLLFTTPTVILIGLLVGAVILLAKQRRTT